MVRSLLLDIETNGENIHSSKLKIWCIVTKDLSDNEVKIWRWDRKWDFSDFDNYLSSYDKLIGHNIINFDWPAIKKYWPNMDNFNVKLIDTLLLSRLFNFYRGGHGVADWATRLGGQQKIKEVIFSEWNEVILERCISDVEIQHKIYNELIKEYEECYSKAIKMEHRFAEIIANQEERGVSFDKKLGESLKKYLEKEIEDLDNELIGCYPPALVRGKTNIKIYLKNGEYAADIKKYFGEDYTVVQGAFSKISFSAINMNSEKQVKNFLYNLGWQPDQWNFKKDKITKKPLLENGEFIKTTPKITLESLETLKGVSGEALKRRFKCKHRLGQVSGLLENIREDGKISAELNTLAAATSRTTHKTVANIPKAVEDVFLGKEMRALFIASEDKVLVGCDASALEARIFAHYLNDWLFTKELLEGDIHQINADNWGISRSLAKNTFYALLYRAGRDKLTQTSGVDGSEIIERFKSAWPSYKVLLDRVDKAARRGYVKAIDGRKIIVKQQHKALNYLIQSADSIIMKLALCMLIKNIQKEGIDAYPIINYHDEYVLESSKKDAKRVAELSRDAIIKSGEYFNLKCPLDGEARIGLNWSEIH